MLLGEVLRGIACRLVRGASRDLVVTDVAYDSRRMVPGSLFVCVPGAAYDGHDFAADAAGRGAAALVVERELDLAIPQVVVHDARDALALASANLFGNASKHMQVAGVTGTAGKTTVAMLVEHLLRSAGMSCGILGTVCNRMNDVVFPHIYTTPESRDLQEILGRMRDMGAQAVSMEVSSHALLTHRCAHTRFSVAAFTNLSRDHLDFHKTMEAYAEVKWSFVRGEYQNLPVINQDDSVGRRFTSRLEAEGRKVLTFGEAGDGIVPALTFTDASVAGNGISFTVRYKDTSRQVTLPLIGRFNIYNALTAAGMLIADGADAAEVLDALPALRPLVGRMEMFSKEGSPLVIVDFAHTPDGIEKSLMAAREHTKGILTCVFGAGGDRDHGKRPLMAASAEKFADRVFVTDDNPRSEDPAAIRRDVAAGFTGALNDVGRKALVRTDFADRAAAIREAILSSKEGDTVAVLGKGHEEFQIVGKKMLPWSDQRAVREILGL